MRGAKKRGVFFDFNGTLYDPFAGELLPGVKEMLKQLYAERPLYLYSTQAGGFDNTLWRLGIETYFDGVHGGARKTAAELKEVILAEGHEPQGCIVVGDTLEAELRAGNELGAETIWLRLGGFERMSNSGHAPTHTVGSIAELRELLESIP